MLKSLDRNLNKLYKFSGYVAAFFLILVQFLFLLVSHQNIWFLYKRSCWYSGYCMAAASFCIITFVEEAYSDYTFEKLITKKNLLKPGV